jgi:hypothetical protein
VAEVLISHVIMAIYTKLQNKEHVLKVRGRAKFKFLVARRPTSQRKKNV